MWVVPPQTMSVAPDNVYDGNVTLHQAVQADKKYCACQTMSATTSHLESCYRSFQTVNLLMIMCEAQLRVRDKKNSL